jgi:hypothetical protein
VSKLSIGPTQAHSESKHAGGQVYEVDEKTEIRKGTPLVEGKRRENIAGSQILRMSMTVSPCRSRIELRSSLLSPGFSEADRGSRHQSSELIVKLSLCFVVLV